MFLKTSIQQIHWLQIYLHSNLKRQMILLYSVKFKNGITGRFPCDMNTGRDKPFQSSCFAWFWSALPGRWLRWVGTAQGEGTCISSSSPRGSDSRELLPSRENLFLREPGRRNLHLKREMLCLTKGLTGAVNTLVVCQGPVTSQMYEREG